MLIAQLSDAHLVRDGQKTLGIAPMCSNLANCVDYLARLEPQPDVVLVTGDLTDSGDPVAMECAFELLAGLPCPFFIVPGNHDDVETLWAQFGGTACPSRTEAGIDYVVEDFALRLIGLDSTRIGACGGELSGSQANWLEQRMAAAGQRPTLIFMHHPPLKCGVLETDEDGFVGSKKMGDVVAKYPNIERIICGHVHLPIHARWCGTVVSTAPGTGMQLSLDLTMRKPSAFVLEAPSCQLHHWTAQQNLITHTVYIRATDGPYPFAPT